MFSPEIDAGGGTLEGSVDKKYQLKSVDFLLGTTTKINDVIVLGMLTQVSTNSYIHGKCIIHSVPDLRDPLLRDSPEDFQKIKGCEP